MKTTTKKVENIKEKEVKENSMKELCILWHHKTESEVEYLSGNLSEELKYQKVIAFYNKNKKNEKEPDIRVYSLDDENKKDVQIISLWNQVSKSNLKYLSGKTNENEDVVAFYNQDDDIKKPRIKVYLKESK